MIFFVSENWRRRCKNWSRKVHLDPAMTQTGSVYDAGPSWASFSTRAPSASSATSWSAETVESSSLRTASPGSASSVPNKRKYRFNQPSIFFTLINDSCSFTASVKVWDSNEEIFSSKHRCKKIAFRLILDNTCHFVCKLSAIIKNKVAGNLYWNLDNLHSETFLHKKRAGHWMILKTFAYINDMLLGATLYVTYFQPNIFIQWNFKLGRF